MGAAHSRARPGAGPAKLTKTSKTEDSVNQEHRLAIQRANSGTQGYFILCLKSSDKVKIVNASAEVLKLVTAVVKKHFTIVKSGWDRNQSFSYKIQKSGHHSLILLTAEVLLTLYKAGWEPMTPIDLTGKDRSQSQTAICFRREGVSDQQSSTLPSSIPSHVLNSGTPLSGSFEDLMQHENKECLCLETYGKNLLGFHDVPNAVLLDLVQCVQQDWPPGLVGISNAVSSVISDYMTVELDVDILPGEIDDRRYLKLQGKPWSNGIEGADLEDAISAENLVLSLVACLARASYKLQISIMMDKYTTVFFFIKDSQGSKEVRLPTFCGVGLGEKNSMYVYRPTITRTKTSFFRSR